MRATVVGAGAVGRRVAQALAASAAVEHVTVVARDPVRAGASIGDSCGKIHVQKTSPGDRSPADVTVVTVPAGARRAAIRALDQGSHVICPVDEPSDVKAMLELDARARAGNLTVAVGTCMAPGLSCVLAARLRRHFERVDEMHVASVGTGGPACARRHHAALAAISVDWVDGGWRRRPGGSGRELVWFPEPVGGADCYRAALADPLLLVPVFPECRRITARLEATRRDRLTSWLPMLRPPHPEGLVGAVRVEVRGWVGGEATTRILGASAAPARVAAAVSTVAALWGCEGRISRTGAAGLAELAGEDPGGFLRDVASYGVTISTFEGAPP